jgi:outer membrane biosynthesis protein TonB
MKLKYYLRGLGTGILFATLILFISYSYHYSDAKIKERAKELGMVETETNKQSILSDITTTNKTTTAENNKETSDKESLEMTTTEDETTSKKDDTTEEPTTTKKQEQTTTKKEEITTKKEEVTTKKEDVTTKQEETTTKSNNEEETTSGGTLTEYVIKITKGMSSEKVAEALRIAGAVVDSKEFNRYLITNGYAEKIRIGTFTIPAGSTYKEIAEIIS